MEDESFPDLGPQSDDELKDLIDQALEEWERVGSDERVQLQGKIDVSRAELIDRLRKRREGPL